MEQQQYMNVDMMKKDNEATQASIIQGAEHGQAPAKFTSQIDKLKLMIIRIGDEKRENVDEHLQKLKA